MITTMTAFGLMMAVAITNDVVYADIPNPDTVSAVQTWCQQHPDRLAQVAAAYDYKPYSVAGAKWSRMQQMVRLVSATGGDDTELVQTMLYMSKQLGIKHGHPMEAVLRQQLKNNYNILKWHHSSNIEFDRVRTVISLYTSN